MIHLGTSGIRTILCVGAHADDIEIGCGGAILKLLQSNENVAVYWVVLSGSGDRKDEAKESANRFLSKARRSSVQIQKFPDTFFPYEGQEIKKFFNELRQQVSPDIIFTHRLEDRHQDHRLVSELTWNSFRDHLIMEYEIPKYEGDLGTPNIYVPLAESICQKKINIIVESFETQESRPWFSPETFWAMLRIRGVESRSRSQFAEGLYCRKAVI